ncbi:sigma factor [Nocardiopsis oceani]
MTSYVHHTPPTGFDDLLTRAGAGDEQAFAALYDRGAATVHGLALRALHDAVLAENATKAVWVRVWRTADEYTPDQGTAMAWVMALAHRTVVELIRSDRHDSGSARVASAHTGSLRVPTARGAPDRGDHLSSSARRRAVLLAYFQGYTSEQIGALLGVPREAVPTMLHSGLMHLRAHLRRADDTGARSASLNTAADADGW